MNINKFQRELLKLAARLSPRSVA